MTAPLKALPFAALLTVLWLAGCVPEVADESKNLTAPTEYISIGDVTFTKAPATLGWTPPQLIDGPYSDPFVGGWISRTSFPTGALIRAARGGTPGRSDDQANFDEAAIIAILTSPDQAITAPATYAISPPPTPGSAVVEYVKLTDGDAVCIGVSGTLSISKFGGVGDVIVGTITVDSWANVGVPCPITTPAAGSFRVRREIDDRTGNDGSGTDTITATDYGAGGPPAPVIFTQTYTESAQTLNDPLLKAFFEQEWDAIAEQIIDRLVLDFGLGADTGIGGYQREYTAEYYGVTGPGAYPKAGGDNLDLKLNNSGSGCSGAVASLTIAALGPVGGLIAGDFSGDASGVSPCPSQFGVTFSVTREADRPILVPELTGDALSIKGITIAERKTESSTVTTNVNLVAAIENLTVIGTRRSPASDTRETATITLYNPAVALQSPQTYVIADTAPTDGTASVQFSTAVGSAPFTPCKGTSGTLTVNSYGGAGGRIDGTFNVTADTCSTLAGAGSFSAAVDSVNTFGNDGSGIDTLNIAINGSPVPGYPRTESTAPLSDPILSGHLRPVGSTSETLSFQSGADRVNNRYQFDLKFTIAPGTGAPGTFVEGSGLTSTINGQYQSICGPQVGTTQVVVSSFPAVGGQITGSFTFTNDSGIFASCPFTTLSGSFAVTREPDDFN